MQTHAGSDVALFNVSVEQLRKIVETAVGEKVQSFSITRRDELLGFQGYAAEKVLPVIDYLKPDGTRGCLKLFVKRMYGLDITEARQYQFLARRNVPTPQVYGMVIGTKDEEIMFFERLAATGINTDDPKEVRAFIGMLARLNAIRPDASDEWQPLPHAVSSDLANGGLIPEALEAAWKHGVGGNMGEEIRAVCAATMSRVKELSAISVQVGVRLRNQPAALLHEDYSPRNTGWRANGEFVVFDVHRLSMGPMFWDLHGNLGSRSDPSIKCIPWEQLVQHYLDTLKTFGGARATIAEFERDIPLLRAANAFHAFPWMLRRTLSGETDFTNDVEEGRKAYRAGMLVTIKTALAVLDVKFD